MPFLICLLFDECYLLLVIRHFHVDSIDLFPGYVITTTKTIPTTNSKEEYINYCEYFQNNDMVRKIMNFSIQKRVNIV